MINHWCWRSNVTNFSRELVKEKDSLHICWHFFVCDGTRHLLHVYDGICLVLFKCAGPALFDLKVSGVEAFLPLSSFLRFIVFFLAGWFDFVRIPSHSPYPCEYSWRRMLWDVFRLFLLCSFWYPLLEFPVYAAWDGFSCLLKFAGNEAERCLFLIY